MEDVRSLKEGDKLIGARRDGVINDFTLWAVVLKNDTEKEEVTISRAMKYGRVQSKNATFSYKIINEYYKRADAELMETLAGKLPMSVIWPQSK